MNDLMFPVKKEFQNWLIKVDQLDGEITPELEKELNVIEANITNRLLTMKDYVISKKALLLSVQQRIEYLKSIKSRIENKAERVKKYIYNYMKENDLDSVTNGIDKLKIRKSPPRIDIIDENKIPDKYFRYKTTLNHAQYIALLTILNETGMDIPKIEKEVNKQAIKKDSTNNIGISGTKKVQGDYLKID